MGETHEHSSTSTDDDSKTKKRKISSTATNVDTAHAHSSESLKSVFLLGKRVLEACSESNANLKEQEKHKEIKSEEFKEMMKTMKDLTKAIKNLQETLLTKPDLLGMVSLKENSKDTQEKEDTCCFDCKEAQGNNQDTIFVKGFQRLRPRNEIKKMLSGVFGQCGEIERVFVPMECDTRVPLGFAFINYKNAEGKEKALEFNGRSLEGKKLKVMLARKRGEFFGYTNFGGCKRCISAIIARRGRRPGPRSPPRQIK